jgi:hypothetical protein
MSGVAGGADRLGRPGGRADEDEADVGDAAGVRRVLRVGRIGTATPCLRTSGSVSISRGPPSLKKRPLCIMVTLSTTRSATSMSCSMMMSPICESSDVRTSISSSRSAGDRPRRRLVEQDDVPTRLGGSSD